MLLVHQTGAVKVGELIRYTLTYDPAADRVLPSPTHLHVRIKNTSAIALRAAYLNGPYTLHVAAYPTTFNPNTAFETAKSDGIPQFEPNLKAGSYFSAKLTVPEDLRLKNASDIPTQPGNSKSVTWIIEITSQILFSSSAAVKYELLIGRDEKSLDYSFTAVSNRHGESGQVQDRQEGKRRRTSHSGHQKGVYSKAISLVIDDTDSLWDRPALPKWEDPPTTPVGRRSIDYRTRETIEHPTRPKNKPKKKIHLVILTHGLHSNLGADMLYMKESIDATAKVVRENARKRKDAARKNKSSKLKDTVTGGLKSVEQDASTAPLSGGQEDIAEEHDQVDDSDEEEVIVRGFPGNATRTEKGIQYLGKRLARYILELTYPDQPVKFAKKKSFTQKISDSMHAKDQPPAADGVPAHEGSQIKKEDKANDNLAYTFTSISFVGHSLGGITQIYAMAYIQKHAPHFFEKVKPINFIAMASPLLGLSNENPMYIKFALDFGLVGRTGQDLGLTWRAPTLAKSGWSAVVGGLGGQKEVHEDDPGAKPLLRVLPTGPAHIVLRKFRNRTIYSNVVNDGIVPLRTSCLLFLDWRGLEKVQKARRENGLVGTMIGWGWAEMTGQNTLSGEGGEANANADDDDASSNSEEINQPGHHHHTDVPQPAQDAVDEDDNDAASLKNIKSSPSKGRAQQRRPRSRKDSPPELSTFQTLWSYIRPSGKATKNDLRMFKRSQTLGPVNDSREEIQVDSSASSQLSPPQSSNSKKDSSPSRPLASRGDSIEDPNHPDSHHAPPKTTIFESAADLLSPPTPPTAWILDPGSRARTIFHDRVYHPEDIPAPPPPKPKRTASGLSIDSRQGSVGSRDGTQQTSNIRVEEKIARAYHRDLSWRKVLVRLEPDAHNNMIVRRMFANAYGWPVVKHLCDTHFGDTYAALTRDEHEPALDRAKGVDKPIGEEGETVIGQESRKEPEVPDELLRQSTNELQLLERVGPKAVAERIARDQSVELDDSYLNDTSDDEEKPGPFQRFWSPAPKSPSSSAPASPQVASQITAESEGLSQSANTAGVGLQKHPTQILSSPSKDAKKSTENGHVVGETPSIAQHIARQTGDAS